MEGKFVFNFLSDLVKRKNTKLIKKGNPRSLYCTREGSYYCLDEGKYLDKCIIDLGVFEVTSTEVVRKLVKPGNVVIDVGANIGYYTVLLSKLVGDAGKIISFEPTENYRKILQKNIDENNITNCMIFPYGLSNQNINAEICIGECSATMHWVDNIRPQNTENITLYKLDDIVDKLGVSQIDFIKVDIDGHEPAFLDGAKRTLTNYDPVILLEVNHLNYLDYGITAWDFYEQLINWKYNIYYEEGLELIENRKDFLVKCGNFSHSANIVISRKMLRG